MNRRAFFKRVGQAAVVAAVAPVVLPAVMKATEPYRCVMEFFDLKSSTYTIDVWTDAETFLEGYGSVLLEGVLPGATDR